MANPLTPDERTQIADMLKAGHSYTHIANTVGRSRGTVGNIARSIGHTAGKTNLSRAHEARSAYCAERRALLASRLTEEAEKLLDQLHQPHVAYNFGGKDNTYVEHEMSEPGVLEKHKLVQAAREALRTVLDIDRHDNRADDRGTAEVDRWLLVMMGKDPEGEEK